MASSLGLLAGHDGADHAGSDRVVERSADRAYAWAIWSVARADGAEQKADRGAAQVVGWQAGEDLTARLAGDVEQEKGLRAIVPAQASWAFRACSPAQACRDCRQHVQEFPGEEGGYRRVLDVGRDHGSHDCRTTRLAPSGGDDNYR